MAGYERPTERGTSPEKVSFYAILHREDGTSHGASLVSPTYGTQPEMVGWVKHYRRDGDEIAAWKRVTRGADFRDERLSSRDDPQPDPQRLKVLLEDMARMLDAKKRELDRGTKRKSAA